MSAGGEQERLESLLDEAEGLRRAGMLGESRQAFRQAARTAERLACVPALITAALGAGGLWVGEEREVLSRASVQALWQRASELAGSSSLERARLGVRMAAEEVYQGGPVDAVFTAVEQVRTFNDDRATADSLSLLHHVLLGPRHANDRCEIAESIISLAARADDALLGLMGLCWRTVDLYLLGEPRANQSLSELRERSATAGCEAVLFIADVLNAMVHARAGRLGEAEEVATKALERGARVGDPDALSYYGAMIGALRWWQGRTQEVIDAVRSLAISPRLGRNDHVYVAADAMISVIQGDNDAAEEALSRFLGLGLGQLPDSSSWLTTQFLVVEAAYLLGDAAAATEAAELLRPYANLPVMPSLAVVCFGSAERALGLAAATVHEFDQAVSHLLAALRFDRWIGCRPMLAVTQQSLAAVLQARALPEDREKAQSAMRQASTQAEKMGMQLPQSPDWLTRSRGRPTPLRPRLAHIERFPGGWRIEVDGRLTQVPNRIGFAYLAQLLEHPGKEFETVTLTSHNLSPSRASPEPILDRAALASYRRRIGELQELVKQPDLPAAVAEEYRRELAGLQAAIRTATGLGGRARYFPDEQERARTAVRKALVRAMEYIAVAEPEFGEHLRRNVVTGATCHYRPEAGWLITVAPAQGPTG